jgi:peptidoglycan/xylan/chitin deacetylase (PgdA/CDA1 family)
MASYQQSYHCIMRALSSSRQGLIPYLLLSLWAACFYVLSVQAQPTPPLSNQLSNSWEQGEIALSLDDAPMPGTYFLSGKERTKKILKALQEVGCPPIGLFAVGEYLSDGVSKKRLKDYAAAGHIIANHGYSHLNLNHVSAEKFIEDLRRAHEILVSLPNFRPFFRFPYLAEGNTKAKRKLVIDSLKAMGYQEGYVTVSNHDYRLNQLFVRAIRQKKIIDYAKLKKLYISILWNCIKENQKIALQLLKRPVKHVLLLHENDLAALFIGDLITHLRAKGWKVISIEEAYQDSLSQLPITNTYSFTGRLGAIAEEQGLSKMTFSSDKINYDYIEKAISEKNIFTSPDNHKETQTG